MDLSLLCFVKSYNALYISAVPKSISMSPIWLPDFFFIDKILLSLTSFSSFPLIVKNSSFKSSSPFFANEPFNGMTAFPFTIKDSWNGFAKSYCVSLNINLLILLKLSLLTVKLCISMIKTCFFISNLNVKYEFLLCFSLSASTVLRTILLSKTSTENSKFDRSYANVFELIIRFFNLTFDLSSCSGTSLPSLSNLNDNVPSISPSKCLTSSPICTFFVKYS